MVGEEPTGIGLIGLVAEDRLGPANRLGRLAMLEQPARDDKLRLAIARRFHELRLGGRQNAQIGAETGRLGLVGPGLLGPVEAREDKAATVSRFEVVGVESNGPVVMLQSVGERAATRQNVGENAVALGGIGRERGGALQV